MLNSNSGPGDLPALRKPPLAQMHQTAGMGFAVNRRFKLRHVSLPKNSYVDRGRTSPTHIGKNKSRSPRNARKSPVLSNYAK